MLGLYDLLTAGVPDAAVDAWLSGREVADSPVDLPRLSPRERAALADAWWFWARPGQHWRPGPEFITAHEGGRGSGKSWAARSAIYDAANNPERWGGHAVVAGAAPDQVDSDMLHGLSGIVSCGHALADAGLIPRFVYNPSKLRIVFRAPRGGGTGLTVLIRASSNPKGGHGPNVGLAWFDEFGVWYHEKTDQAGKNLWRALRPAIRAGDPDSKVILTYTPSRAAEVRLMQANAERPECTTCRTAWLAAHGGKYSGEPMREPWRLPRSAQPRLHSLLGTRTTEVVRTCEACGGEVVATVRTVFFDTRDNPHTDAASRERAASDLATGRAEYRQQYAPRGEIDSTVEGCLVRHEDVRKVEVQKVVDTGRGPVVDRWAEALRELGIVDVVVVVDPAVTATDSSDETGVVASGLRSADGRASANDLEQAVALQDWSVRPDEVDGAPSLVWAPRAYWLAVRWGASRIVVETNQGGEEVLSAVRDLVRRPPSEREVLAELRGEFDGASDAGLGALSRRLTDSARRIEIETVHRRADKDARFEWYGRTAARGQQAVACVPWLDGARHWSTSLAQITGHEPAREGAPRRKPRKDRGDALVSAAQVLLRVVESRAGDVEEPDAGPGWMSAFGRARK